MQLKKILESRLTFSIVLLFIILIQNIITTPDFFSMTIRNGLLFGHIPSLLANASQLIIVAIAMTLITAVAGGQDISVGSMMAISAAFCGLMLNGPEYRTDVFMTPFPLAIFVGLIGGALCGVFNGFLVSFLKIQPMIASLILFTAGRSIAKLITHSQTIFIMNPVFRYLGVQIPGVPIRTPIIISIFIVILVVIILKKTSLGLYIESIGLNSSASRLVGIKSTTIKMATYIIAGVLCGIAGLMSSSNVGTVNSDEIGRFIELDAILAVALGGTLLSGGKFSIAGSVIGAYTIQAITTTMLAMNIPGYQINVFKAVVIVIIVVLSSEVFKEKFKLFAGKVKLMMVKNNG